jgi:hypothetical protein
MVKGRIKPVFTAQPSLIPIGNVNVNDNIKQNVKISSYDKQPVPITNILYDASQITIYSIETNSTEVIADITITPVTKGTFDETIVFRLGTGYQKDVKVRILGTAN